MLILAQTMIPNQLFNCELISNLKTKIIRVNMNNRHAFRRADFFGSPGMACSALTGAIHKSSPGGRRATESVKWRVGCRGGNGEPDADESAATKGRFDGGGVFASHHEESL